MTQLPEPLERDPRYPGWEGWPGAVLLDDEIRYHCTQVTPPLISPFRIGQLKPARYVLTLGNEARVGGEVRKINTDNPLVIEPHQVAVVKTDEEIVLPRFLIGRWNLTVGQVYRGLLWTGALQVDPGWRGYLPCPLYNLSDKPIELRYQERLFTIDFVRTTKYDKGLNKPYPTPSPEDPEHPLNPSIIWFDNSKLHSGPYEKLNEVDNLKKLITSFQEEINETRRLAINGMTFLLVILGVIVTAIALIPAINAGAPFLKGKDGLVAIVATLALFVSLGRMLFAWRGIIKRK